MLRIALYRNDRVFIWFWVPIQSRKRRVSGLCNKSSDILVGRSTELHKHFHGWAYLSTNGNYLALSDAADDEVDIIVDQNSTASLPTAAPTFGAILWSCYSATCLVDLDPFYTGPPPQGQGDALGIISPVTGDFNVTTVPEPSGLPLLGFGLLALGMMARLKRVTPV